MLLHHLHLLGSGAEGAMFAMSTSTDMDPTRTTTSRTLAIKISWLPSTQLVEK